MYRLLVLTTVLIATLAAPHTPALGRMMEAGALGRMMEAGAPGRMMEAGDAAVARGVTPAVVNIATWKVRAATTPGEAARRVRTYGSGFVIDPSGIIVTNKHVIDGAIDVKVVFSDGNRVPARLLAAAAMVDIAVLKVDVGNPLPALQWGDSNDLQVGDPVLSVGNQLDIGLAVSAGIVSGLNRDLQDSPFDSYIQTDATINHGNSGGPLVDTEGKVVGIDTALYNPDQSGGFIGIGFAIPSNTAKFVVDRLLDPHHPVPGWLGVTLQDLTSELADALGVPRFSGAIISAVDPSGPANRASLRPGDVIETVDGEKVTDSRAFMRDIVALPIGTEARLTIWRDDERQQVTAKVAEWPNFMPGGGVMSAKVAEAMIAQVPDPGIRLAALTDETRKQYGLDPKQTGVLVSEVEQDCEASDLGIVAGDVITAVQGQPVATPNDVRTAVREAYHGHRPNVAVLIKSKQSTKWVSISVSSGS